MGICPNVGTKRELQTSHLRGLTYGRNSSSIYLSSSFSPTLFVVCQESVLPRFLHFFIPVPISLSYYSCRTRCVAQLWVVCRSRLSNGGWGPILVSSKVLLCASNVSTLANLTHNDQNLSPFLGGYFLKIWYWNARPKRLIASTSPNCICHCFMRAIAKGTNFRIIYVFRL